MFEVILTRRSDFTEHAVERFATREEAQQTARRLAYENYDQVARAWVRAVSPVKTEN